MCTALFVPKGIDEAREKTKGFDFKHQDIDK